MSPDLTAQVATTDWTAQVAAITAVVAILLFFIDKWWIRIRSKTQEKEEEIAVLVALHQHFLICCNVISEWWNEIGHEELVPGFCLPTLGIEKIFELAVKRLRHDPEMIKIILMTYGQHSFLNAKWQYYEYCYASQPTVDFHRGEDVQYALRMSPFRADLERAIPIIYHDTCHCLTQIEKRLKESKASLDLKEGSHTVPQELDTMQKTA